MARNTFTHAPTLIVIVASLHGPAALGGCSAPSHDASASSDVAPIVGGAEVPADAALAKHVVALLRRPYPYEMVIGPPGVEAAAVDGGLAAPADRPLCTGVIIGRRRIATAAHCLDNEYAQQALGAVGFGTRPYAMVLRDVDPSGTVVHRDFREPPDDAGSLTREPPTAINDVAIVTLREDIPPGFEAVRILPDGAEFTVGDSAVLAGFGATLADSSDMGERLPLKAVRVDVEALWSRSKEILFHSPGRGACKGDSGGPAFVSRRGGVYLVGITSRGEKPCDVGENVYTDARAFRAFLAPEKK